MDYPRLWASSKGFRSVENFSGGAGAWQARSTMRLELALPFFSRTLHASRAESYGSEARPPVLRLLPSYARLFHWRAERWLRHMRAVRFAESLVHRLTQRARSSHTLSLRALVLVAALLLPTASCGLVSENGEPGSFGENGLFMPPGLSKTRSREGARRTSAPWSYVLPVDHGVRVDESGQGHFRAPRFHGEHNGIDLLAPVGTPVFAACDGQVMAGSSRSFGHWLHLVCPVPPEYQRAGAPVPWASFFYAHLEETNVEPLVWIEVRRAQALGIVGKTGNAVGESVLPHLHLELIVQKNQRAAMDEQHLGVDQSSVGAAELFQMALEKECLDPFGFHPKSQQLRRARRVDPFVALSCLSDRKPDFRRAPAPLDWASRAWDHYYEAERFNVNRGLEDQLARR